MVPTDRIGMSSASYGDVSLIGCTGHGGRRIIMWTAVVVVVMRKGAVKSPTTIGTVCSLYN